jgi:flagellar assembly protein FliH
VKSAPAVAIGQQLVDSELLKTAEGKLSHMLPMVNVVTDSAGMRFIPLTEVGKIEQTFTERIAEADKLAYQRGHDQGHASGLNEGLTKSREVSQQFSQAICDAVDQRQSLLEEAKEQVLALVMQISRKVTHDAINADPEIVAEMIKGVINGLIDPSRLKIKVNPNYLPIIEQNINEFLKSSTAIKDIAIEADPRVTSGGCFIETPGGDIDARLESQFEVVADQLEAGEDN